MTERYTTTIESPWEIHPDKYQVMPTLNYDKYRALKNLIEADGINVPIMVDADMFILDGHHRRMAWLDLLNAGSGIPGPVQVDVRADLTTEEQKMELVYSLNAVRRDPTDDEVTGMLRDILKKYTHWSNRRIANNMGVSQDRVNRLRGKMEELDTIEHFDALQGRDGRWYGSYFDEKFVQRTINKPTREEAEEALSEGLAKKEEALEIGRRGTTTPEERDEQFLEAVRSDLPDLSNQPIREVVMEALRQHPGWPDQRLSKLTGAAIWMIEAYREKLEESGEIQPQKTFEAGRRLGSVSLGEIERYTGIAFPEAPHTPEEEKAFNMVAELAAYLKDTDQSGITVARHVADDPTFAYGLGQDYDFLIEWIREFVVELLKIGEGSEVQQLRGRIEGS